MTAVFQAAPTYAEVILVDPANQRPPKFNPIWLNWFLQLAKNLGPSGAGSVTGVTATGPLASSGGTAPAISITPGTARQVMETNSAASAVQFTSWPQVKQTLTGTVTIDSGFGAVWAGPITNNGTLTNSGRLVVM